MFGTFYILLFHCASVSPNPTENSEILKFFEKFLGNRRKIIVKWSERWRHKDSEN